ncbi:MAG: L-seryl-tRNA(Sec) selenium transferase [Chloroflexi bacterium]|nr:L-seryl-tRNA(Sec) selenium transferase [Chloroflexota bacterium]
MTTALRRLPSVDSLLQLPPLRARRDRLPHSRVVEAVRRELGLVRQAVRDGAACPSQDEIAEAVAAHLDRAVAPSLCPVINATGVILHTNLGRAPLSSQAVAAMAQAAAGYTNLELDLGTGQRGSRQVHVAVLLSRLTGAEAAVAVNNNASAVLLTLTALARGREVIVSRGQAVEIGGGFRVPEVMRASGADLIEVGTTNRTYQGDYEQAITDRTAALLSVHTSNFRIVGFTHETQLQELADLARRTGVLLIHDLGSGCLLDTRPFGLAPEPTVQQSLAAGSDLVLFSGDKLLGGPQAGIIVGRSSLVDEIARHPMARAVRIDKLSLAALSATLLHYLRDEATSAVPVWRMIAAPPAALRARARHWARQVGLGARVVQGRSAVGGGSLPEETLPTWLLSLSEDALGCSAEQMAQRLRQPGPNGTPLLARIERGTLLLDPRTVLPEQDRALVAALRAPVARAG